MHWYENEVRQLEKKLARRVVQTEPPDTDQPATSPVLFYGSSSIRLWTTLADAFPDVHTLNAGFGGSTLAACAWFFDRLIVPVSPRSVVFYAGDNDLGDGRHPEEVYLFFRAFAENMVHRLPGVPLTFMSIKVSPARWHIANQIRLTNELIASHIDEFGDWQVVDMTTPLLDVNGRPHREYFESDGLHLSASGYRVWERVLQQQTGIF